MNTVLPRSLLAAVIVVGASIADVAQAQRVEASATAITSSGTISEFGAQGLSIKTPAGAQPVRFISNDTTNFVDSEGNPVPLGSVQAGMPATIHYTKVGDTLIASKVVVGAVPAATAKTTVVVPPAEAAAPASRVETTTTTRTTTTTSAGTVAEIVPGGFVVASADGVPVRYRYSERTVYVDEAGNRIAADTIRTGAPVTVHFDTVGNVLIANRVVIGRTATATPRSPASIAVPGQVVAPGAQIEVETRRQTTTIER